LYPAAVSHVSLAAFDLFGFFGIHQRYFDAAVFEQGIQRHPVDTGGFHRDA
jgi:hypothetical protein